MEYILRLSDALLVILGIIVIALAKNGIRI